MRPLTPPKLTKRQRKNARGYNAMCKRSIDNGEELVARDGARYRGANPKYMRMRNPKTGLEELTKVALGIPFVRIA